VKAFLWFMLCLELLTVFVRLGFLARNNYPRTVSYAPLEDVAGVVCASAFLLWIVSLMGEL
jgi:hypothetical protein